MIRILFVDDEQSILDGLRRTLRSMRSIWEAAFVNDGNAALAALEANNYHAIVTDMRMPVMDGLVLLKHIKEQHPEVLRVVLSGQSEMESIVKAAGVAHHYLTKPCAMDLLRSTIERAFSLRRLFAKPALLRTIHTLQTTDAGRCDQLGLIPLFSNGGTETRCACASTFRAERATSELRSLYAERIARLLVASDGDLHAQAKAGALQADVGQMVIRCHFGEQYKEVETLVEKGARTTDAEAAVFGTTHAECSAYLLAQAGFSDIVIEAVAYHHSPSACPDPDNAVLLAVHLADVLVDERRGDTAYDLAFVQKMGQVDDLSVWRAVAAPVGACHV